MIVWKDGKGSWVGVILNCPSKSFPVKCIVRICKTKRGRNINLSNFFPSYLLYFYIESPNNRKWIHLFPFPLPLPFLFPSDSSFFSKTCTVPFVCRTENLAFYTRSICTGCQEKLSKGCCGPRMQQRSWWI